MSKKAISRYTAKVLISQSILLVVCLIFLFSIHLIRKNFTNENVNISCAFKECNGTVSEDYPEEPKLEDCERMKTCKCNLCYADVAEITGNLTICEKVPDLEIRVFCMTKVTLNSTKCFDINDIELRQSCLESIQMKTGR